MARPSPRDIGHAFEAHALRFLTSLHMSLAHVGGAGDGGVDLRGYWWLPRRPGVPAPALRRDGNPAVRSIQPARVLAQCKAERRVLGPRAVRELEGVMAHLEHDKHPALAVLLSQSGFTPAAMAHAQRTPKPMLLVHLPGGRVGEVEGEVEVAGAWWNAPFAAVLAPLGVEIRREVAVRPGGVAAGVGVWYDGRRMERFGPPLDKSPLDK
ncbi:hypothetical protein Q8F55_008293 [Vanrija albida]|uniref:Restriction endonuclease type IV Mrr domain-containing protein n=1 Tax=Vanrija albida TaxID=181172 RepID=A0ABR3PVV1_9TREE